MSRLDSRILIRLGTLRYVTGVLLRRWAWLILSNPVTSSRLRPVSYVWVSTVQITARQFAEVTIVSKLGCQMNTEAEIMSNFLHSKIGLAQDYGISSLPLGYRSQLGHKSIYDLLNLAKLGSRNGLLPEGNWIPSRLCTFADYS